MSAIAHVRLRLSLRWMLILVGVIAITLGLLSYRIRSQQDSLHRLRQLGGQMEMPEMNLLAWIQGMSIESVQFLGPHVGNESIDDIGDASVNLDVKQMTFFETRVTYVGLNQLKRILPNAEIRLVTPSLAPEPGIPIEIRDRR